MQVRACLPARSSPAWIIPIRLAGARFSLWTDEGQHKVGGTQELCLGLARPVTLCLAEAAMPNASFRRVSPAQ